MSDQSERGIISLVTPAKNRPATRTGARWLDMADRGVYALVAVLFLVAAFAMAVYSVVTFAQHLRDDFTLDLITFINDLLLVLIILEVLGTVRSYLETGTTSLEPFLYIGTISATRRILAIGAQTTLKGAADEMTFRHLMIDLGINGAVVLALAIALFLLTRQRSSTPAGEGSSTALPAVAGDEQ